MTERKKDKFGAPEATELVILSLCKYLSDERGLTPEEDLEWDYTFVGDTAKSYNMDEGQYFEMCTALEKDLTERARRNLVLDLNWRKKNINKNVFDFVNLVARLLVDAKETTISIFARNFAAQKLS